jgi:hypothetical protein
VTWQAADPPVAGCGPEVCYERCDGSCLGVDVAGELVWREEVLTLSRVAPEDLRCALTFEVAECRFGHGRWRAGPSVGPIDVVLDGSPVVLAGASGATMRLGRGGQERSVSDWLIGSCSRSIARPKNVMSPATLVLSLASAR